MRRLPLAFACLISLSHARALHEQRRSLESVCKKQPNLDSFQALASVLVLDRPGKAFSWRPRPSGAASLTRRDSLLASAFGTLVALQPTFAAKAATEAELIIQREADLEQIRRRKEAEAAAEEERRREAGFLTPEEQKLQQESAARSGLSPEKLKEFDKIGLEFAKQMAEEDAGKTRTQDKTQPAVIFPEAIQMSGDSLEQTESDGDERFFFKKAQEEVENELARLSEDAKVIAAQPKAASPKQRQGILACRKILDDAKTSSDQILLEANATASEIESAAIATVNKALEVGKSQIEPATKDLDKYELGVKRLKEILTNIATKLAATQQQLDGLQNDESKRRDLQAALEASGESVSAATLEAKGRNMLATLMKEQQEGKEYLAKLETTAFQLRVEVQRVTSEANSRNTQVAKYLLSEKKKARKVMASAEQKAKVILEEGSKKSKAASEKFAVSKPLQEFIRNANK